MTTTHNFQDIRRIGELSNDGVFIYNLVTRSFYYINESFPKIFVEDGDSIMSLPGLVLKCIKAEDKHYLISRFNDLLGKGCITSTEFRLEFPDGLIKHICCDAYVMENDTMIVGFVKDFTKTKEHEDFIINYGAKKDTLLDMITHNLSGPLNLSKNIIALVQKVVKDNNFPDISTQLNLIAESTQECIDIVNDFLKEEHQVSAHTYVRKTRFDIIDRINAVLGKLRELNKDKHFCLITDLKNLNINSDSVKFFQVIHNVLLNSIKFTPPDGRIDVRVEEAEEHFTISITDNGIGIPEHLQPLIFQQRSPAGRLGLKGEKSMGLGLFIAKQLVEIMGGTIWFESREAKGATFFIRLLKE